MSQPKVPKIKMPGQSQLQMPEPLINVTLNPEIFEQLIKSQGVRMIHSRPVPCPNVRDINSPEHNPACNMCYNGFLYYNEREFTGGYMGNNLDHRFNANGTWDMDQATVIVPVRDTLGDILDVQYFDRIVLPDFTVRYYHRVEHSQSGIDRLQFPAFSVDYLVDANGQRYNPGTDFVIQDGRIKWIGKRPGYDPVLQRGIIYSVNFYTRPTYTVVGLPHQLRIAQTKGDDGANIEARFPMLCIVRKDFIPFDYADSIGEPDRPEPRNGSF